MMRHECEGCTAIIRTRLHVIRRGVGGSIGYACAHCAMPGEQLVAVGSRRIGELLKWDAQRVHERGARGGRPRAR